jgi:hypothetical protein
MSRPVNIVYLGENPIGPRWQAQPQALNSAFGRTQAETRASFVEAWNDFNDDELTEDDFDFTQVHGPAEDEDEQVGPADSPDV